MITAFYVSLLAFLLIALSVDVIKVRRKDRVGFGDNNDYNLQKRVRAHANFVEYTPIFLILLGCLEYLGLPDYGVHTLGVIFLFSRLSHAYGLSFAERFEGGNLVNIHYRAGGVMGTFLTIIISATLILIILASSQF